MNAPDRPLPLTPLSMAVLLALSEEARHGYAIRQELEARTDGVPLGTSSLYAALRRLSDEGLIEEVSDPTDARRRSYRVTANGRAAARAEALRMARVAGRARDARLVTGPELAGEAGLA
ncbi:MAG: PadR family transcriptional regulator [Gemmatimonadota bacterium]|jgi:DNA-binding PadR family transcriptional regulator